MQEITMGMVDDMNETGMRELSMQETDDVSGGLWGLLIVGIVLYATAAW